MKILLSLCILAVIPCIVFSQNLIWQKHIEQPAQILPDGNGNVYVNAGYYTAQKPDTLRKFDAAGNLLWAVPTLQGYLIYNSGSGVYQISSWDSAGIDGRCAINYFDAITGVRLWSRVVPGFYPQAGGYTDKDGNLYVMYGKPLGTNRCTSVILKLNPAGDKIFETELLLPELQGIQEQQYMGFFLDGDNRSWAICRTITIVNKTKRDSSEIEYYTYTLVLLNSDGAIALNKTILNAPIYIMNSEGLAWYEANDPVSSLFPNGGGFYEGKLVFVTSNRSLTTTSSHGSFTYREYSEWNAMVVSDEGEVNSLIYRGPGCVTDGDYSGDHQSNELYGVFCNDDGIFLIGQIFEGTSLESSTASYAVAAYWSGNSEPDWVQKLDSEITGQFSPSVREPHTIGIITNDKKMLLYRTLTGTITATLTFPLNLGFFYGMDFAVDSTSVYQYSGDFVYKFDLSYELYVVPSARWKLLSVPYIYPDQRTASIFPEAVSSAFGYSFNGYKNEETLENGRGYWIKLKNSYSRIPATGTVLTTISTEVNDGWNLVGTVSTPVVASATTCFPAGIHTSKFFGYRSGKYMPMDTLYSGEGYWVKIDQSGSLSFSASGASLAKSAIQMTLPDADPPPPPGGDGSDGLSELIPAEMRLAQNYPNPFNPTTRISFTLPSEGYISLAIYNLLGEKVATLAEMDMESGAHEFTWNAANQASGVYFYTLKSGSFSETKKLLLMK